MRIAVLLALLTSTAAAFEAPTGFNGHAWGTSLQEFGPGLQLWSVRTVRAAQGKMTTLAADADIWDVEGDGSHAMAEYDFPSDRNPWALDRIQLQSIGYLFCHNNKGEVLPQDVRDKLALCGARVKFTSDTAAQLLQRPKDYRSNYERIMRRLVIDYGEPPGLVQKGEVIVDEAEEQEAPGRPDPPFAHYRWCGLVDDNRELYPDCAATVSLAFDRTRGEGVILFATNPLYAFAWAVHTNGDANNEIYRMLGGKPLEEKVRKIRRQCTGTLVCQNVRRTLSDQQRSAYEIPPTQSAK